MRRNRKWHSAELNRLRSKRKGKALARWGRFWLRLIAREDVGLAALAKRYGIHG